MRGKFMTSFVRSRLMYNAATWDPHDINIQKLEVEWVLRGVMPHRKI